MAKTLFDHLSAITTDQDVRYYDQLDAPDRKTFSSWMVHRFISMTPEYIPVVAAIIPYYEYLDDRTTYLFYSNVLPMKRVFAKYIKPDKVERHPEWLLALVSQHYQVNFREAAQYVDIYYSTPDGQTALHHLCE